MSPKKIKIKLGKNNFKMCFIKNFKSQSNSLCVLPINKIR